MCHQFIPLRKIQERKKNHLIGLKVLLKGKLEVLTQMIKNTPETLESTLLEDLSREDKSKN